MKLKRVFCINQNAISETKHYSELTDAEFMDVAEAYTLKEFEFAFNNEEVSTVTDVIRFIEIEVSEDNHNDNNESPYGRKD